MEQNTSNGEDLNGSVSGGEGPANCGVALGGCGPGIVEEHLIYTITVPLSSAIILANLLIILAIGCNRQLHTTPNYFFLSLLVADLCTGVALPFIPWMGFSRPLSFGACLLVHVLPNFLFLAFLLNLVMVHYERYRSIVSPLRHRSSLWLHRRYPLVLLALWLPPLLFALLPAFGWNNWHAGRDALGGCCRATPQTGTVLGRVRSDSDPRVPGTDSEATADSNCSLSDVVLGGCGKCCCTYRHVFPNAFIYLEVYGILLPAILSIVVMTVRVLVITHRQLEDIRRLKRSVMGRLGQADEQGRRGSRGRRQMGLDLRYARCVAAVSLTFLACWVPYIIYTHVGMAFLLRPNTQRNPTAHIILSCAGIGGMTVVPLVLGLANREYTGPIKKFLRKLHDRWRQRNWCSRTIVL